MMFDAKSDATVRADERAVKQMMINLLSNAVKFSRPGGIAVLFVEALPDKRVAFGVRDTGVGMTAEEQQKALEPFRASGLEGNGGRPRHGPRPSDRQGVDRSASGRASHRKLARARLEDLGRVSARADDARGASHASGGLRPYSTA